MQIIDEEHRKELSRIFSGEMRFDCGMDQFTTFRVGGKADVVCFPHDLIALQQLVSFINREAIASLVVGRGSNILVRDGGFGGIVIILKGMLASIEKNNNDKSSIKVGAGASIADLLSFCSRYNLAGVEFLAGVPGTVGGAAAMNAGAFGREFCNVVLEIQFITSQGELVKRTNSQLGYAYRKLNFPVGEIIVSVKIQLEKEEPGIVNKRITENLKTRNATQPLDMPSGGSVFKNPPGDYAGRLIEEAGLKGKRSGGAMISPKHANFIVNTGNAKAQDVLSLITLVRKEVRDRSGIDLEPEIHVIGDSI